MILRHLFRLIGGGACSLLAGFSLHAATLPAGFTEVQVANGLTNATAMAFSPDGRLFVCQQAGPARHQQWDSPADSVCHGDDEFYRRAGATGSHVRSGFRHQPVCLRLLHGSTTPDPQSRQPFHCEHREPQRRGSWERDRYSRPGESEVATNHNGGAIHFGPDGKLYIAVGENAIPSNSQILTNRHGKTAAHQRRRNHSW